MNESPIPILHLVYIPFTGVGVRPWSEGWLQKRVQIFKDYTLRSFVNQTSKSFILWISFRPEEEGNPLVAELADAISAAGLTAVFTFNGLMYWDDKFSTGPWNRLMNCARIVRQAWRGKDIRALRGILEVWNGKNRTLRDRLRRSLAFLASTKGFTGVKWVYLSRIDSDDMFARTYIEEVQKQQPFQGAVTCRNGYVYHTRTGQVAEWKPRTNPPFHTILFPVADFYDPDRHLQYYRGYRSHEDIPRVFPTIPLKDGLYCVTIHDSHISTLWDHPFKGKEVDRAVLKDFLDDEI